MEDELGIGAIIASFGLFLIYHIVVVVALYYPQYLHIPLANNIENAVVWITKHKERDDANSGTLAVQTLRNAILAAVFISIVGNGNSMRFSLRIPNWSCQLFDDTAAKCIGAIVNTKWQY
jgi:hypothetical protein